MEQYNSIQQLLKKEGGEKNPVFPPTVVQAVFDAKTGASLEAILAQFNSVYLQYQGSPKATRLIIPKEMRRAGLTITYMNMEGETITERASSAVQKDNDNWGLDINWSRVDELSLSGDISVSAKGTWIINGHDTGVKAVGPKGDAGLTPWLKTIDNRLHISYDNVTWEPCSDPIAAYFRWSSNKIQISRDNKTWTDLSGTFADNLYIKGYVATTSALPSSAAQGDIYGVGPTYAAEDTARTNPIYRYYVRNAGTWVDNGPFTSIAAGIVQETGDSENVVMSQKAVTEKLSELGSEVSQLAQNAIAADSLRYNTTTNDISLEYETLDGKSRDSITFPAATTDSAGVMSAEDKIKLWRSLTTFIDTTQVLNNPVEETNYEAGKIIKHDGSIMDLGVSFVVYTIENVNSNNKVKYVSFDFGEQVNLIFGQYINCALYDKDGTLSEGYIVHGKKIMQIPANYILRISVLRTINANKIYSSMSIKEDESKQIELFLDSSQELYSPTIIDTGNLVAIKKDGSFYPLDESYGLITYEINNIEGKKALFAKVDFGAGNIDDKQYYNCCLYDKYNVVVVGYVTASIRYIRIPYGHTLRVTLPSNNIVYKSNAIITHDVNELVDDVKNIKIVLYEDSLTKSEPLIFNEYDGGFVNLEGKVVSLDGFKYTELIDINECDKVSIHTTVRGGLNISIISFYDVDGNFIESVSRGTESDTITINETYYPKMKGYKFVRVSTNDYFNIQLFSYSKENKDIVKVQTWGDSITAAGQYQIGIASGLGLGDNAVKNAGIPSDFSMHVRNRFVSYFTEEIPYVGKGSYSVPSLDDRKKELADSFFVFWIGTNNLMNSARKQGSWTTGSTDYTALQPNPNFKFDRLYSKAYKDMMLDDIRQMVALIPHNRYIIISGHGGFSTDTEMYKKMIEVDDMLARMFPKNFVDIRELVCMDYAYQDTQLIEDFVKPSLNANVTLKLSDTSWIGNTANSSYDICVGTKSIYDKYHVISVDGNNVVATLVESNTEFVEGDIITKDYLLVSDLGRDAVTIPTSIYSHEDCVNFGLMSFPRSSSDPIHFTTEQYVRIGELIANEIKNRFE